MRGKRQPQVAFFEKTLLEALRPKTKAQRVLILGRLRIVYGFFWLQ